MAQQNSKTHFIDCLSDYLREAERARVSREQIRAETRRHQIFCNTQKSMHAREQREFTKRLAIRVRGEQHREEEKTERFRLACERDYERNQAKLQAFETLCDTLALEIGQKRLHLHHIRDQFVAACRLIESSSLGTDERRAVILLLGDLLNMQRELSNSSAGSLLKLSAQKYLPNP